AAAPERVQGHRTSHRARRRYIHRAGPHRPSGDGESIETGIARPAATAAQPLRDSYLRGAAGRAARKSQMLVSATETPSLQFRLCHLHYQFIERNADGWHSVKTLYRL